MRRATLGLVLLATLSVACQSDERPPPFTTTTTSSTASTTTTSTTTTTTEPIVTTTTTVVDADTVVITRVVDGDTVDLADGRRVRLIGIDTPEVYGGVECYGPEASARAKELVAAANGVGRIQLDPSQGELDRYGRTLAYVWLGDVTLNETLVAEGFAEEYLYRTPYALRANFVLAEMRAQAAGLGLWGAC